MMHFSLALDSYFLPKPVEDIVQKQEFSKVPLITGITNDEFGFLLAAVSKKMTFIIILNNSKLTRLESRQLFFCHWIKPSGKN